MATIQPLKMQPTFTVDVPLHADEAAQRIRRFIRSSDFHEHTASAGRCVDFRIEPTEQRFWSPHLSVQLSDTESGSQLFGRFSPRPEIWTMFMAIYAVVASSVFGAAIYGYVQWFMGDEPWALLLVPLGLLSIAALHIASVIGQGLSCDQMETLRSRLDHALQAALDSAEDVASGAPEVD